MMKWYLQKTKNVWWEDNYFRQYRNFNLSLVEQMQYLDDLKKGLPENEHLGIELQKHFLWVAETLDAIGCINSDDSHGFRPTRRSLK